MTMVDVEEVFLPETTALAPSRALVCVIVKSGERITHHDQTLRCQTRSLALTGKYSHMPIRRNWHMTSLRDEDKQGTYT